MTVHRAWRFFQMHVFVCHYPNSVLIVTPVTALEYALSIRQGRASAGSLVQPLKGSEPEQTEKNLLCALSQLDLAGTRTCRERGSTPPDSANPNNKIITEP